LAALVEDNCLDCHGTATPEGKLDLQQLPFDLSDQKAFDRWVRIHDRVAADEMPPPEHVKLPVAERAKALQPLAEELRRASTCH
jgi:hypothetical protein